MSKNKPVIAIDGPAASGKGTLARALAEKLGFAFMDTGALYRGVAFEVLEADNDPDSTTDAEKAALLLAQKIEHADKPADILGNPKLREEIVGQTASKVAALQEVREALLKLQRDFAANPGKSYKGAVLDGRDIGTVICPDADLKLFITAQMEVRAKRRLKELQSKDISVTYDAVLADMRARDARDSERSSAPLKPADDAVTIDTSSLSAEQVFDLAYKKALAMIHAK